MGKISVHNLPRLLSGFGAVLLSLYFMVCYRADVAIVVASVYFTIACLTDTLRTRIPNWLNLGMVVTAVTINTLHAGWSGLGQSISGLLLGIALLLFPYIMGGFGAGDVKALGALGALTGPMALLHIFVYMALYGGGLAVLHILFNRNLTEKIHAGWVSAKAAALSRDPAQLKPGKTEPLRFPYAAAIACGYYSYIAWGGIALPI